MPRILESVMQIMDRGKYKKSTRSEAQMKATLNGLFKLHKEERTEENAKRIHEEILELARLGKGELAMKFAMQLEKEVNYEQN